MKMNTYKCFGHTLRYNFHFTAGKKVYLYNSGIAFNEIISQNATLFYVCFNRIELFTHICITTFPLLSVVNILN